MHSTAEMTRNLGALARGAIARTVWLGILAAVVALGTAKQVGAQTMEGLGFLPDATDQTSYATGISDDGTVVGYGRSAQGNLEAFVWTNATGMVGLGFFPDATSQYSYATGISNDGTVVGYGRSAQGNLEAFVWTNATGMVGLGFLPNALNQQSYAYGISNDGAVVGYGYNAQGNFEAFVWTNATGMVGLGFLPNSASPYSIATGISDDGTVVGHGRNAQGNYEAFVWTNATGMVVLGSLPNTASPNSNATGISNDGTVVGYGYNAQGNQEAFLLRLQVVIDVVIDVVPGTTVNPISRRSQGDVLVVIPSTADFDARWIDPNSVLLGDPLLTDGAVPSGDKVKPRTYRLVRRRVNRMYVYDLWLFIKTPALFREGALNSRSTNVVLTGETFEGDAIKGSDTVKIVR